MNDILNQSIIKLKGIGSKTEEAFNKMGVYTIGDILSFFPRDYIHLKKPVSISEISVDEENAILGVIKGNITVIRRGNFFISKGYIDTKNGVMEVVWYRMPYIKKTIKYNMPYIFYGRVLKKGNIYRFEHPKMYIPDEYENMRKSPVPVYRLSKGLTSKTISKAVENALSYVSKIEDTFPEWLIKKRNLPSLSFSIKHIHFPINDEDIIKARSRFIYEELLKFSLEEEKCINNKKEIKNSFLITKFSYAKKVIDNLPFNLTEGQLKTISDIFSDFKGKIVTERLVQGDVGCGKTIVAFISMITMAENGYQSLIMVPTGVLAVQHFNSFKKLIEDYSLDLKIALLTGNTKKSEKKAILKDLKDQKIDLVVGTHALIEKDVIFKNLALSITDEQHRFGVKQRNMLLEEEMTPFSILLSATPIPRTLALILYNGMNISRIMSVPSERKKVKTAVITPSMRQNALKLILKEVQMGHQAYIVCPLVEKSDNMDKENVLDYEAKLKDSIGDLCKIGILHGKMKGDEKDEIVNKFINKEIDILISTTVIEVGVNVPSATVMMIEDADRFGLSTLHQLRGRVGRGESQSYCILVNSANSSNENAKKRLMTVRDNIDGFKIAETDLKLRGPGDRNGVRQSGEEYFNLASIYSDFDIMKDALEDAKEILSKDKDLSNEDNFVFKKMIENNEYKFYTNL